MDSRSEHARAQDERWQRWIAGLRETDPVPFAEHRRAFGEIFAGRAADDGPPRAWQPDPDAAARTNLGRWMAELGVPDYHALHARTAGDRNGFWFRVLDRLGIVFRTRPGVILDPDSDVRNPVWLPGAELDITESCFTADPDHPAIVSAGEESPTLRVTTYAELERLVDRVASGLRRAGFAPGDRIALYLPMTMECVAAYLGIVRAGGCVVSIADSFSPVEVAKRLEIAGAKGIVTVDAQRRGGKTLPMYAKVREAGAPRAVVIAEGRPVDLRPEDLTWETLLASGARPASVAGLPDRPINVLFSSGTTGTPKAIPWTQLTPIKCAMDGHFHQDVRPGDVVAWPTNIGWMMGPWLIFASLINRATIALWEGAPHAEGFTRFLDDAGVTMLGTVPSLVRAWRTGGAMRGRRWRSVRAFSSTGEPSGREDTLWLMSRTDYRAPVIEYLGGTEIGGGHITGTLVQPASPATFTTPALGIDFRLLDETGREVGLGETGELFLVPPAIGLSQKLLNADHDRVYHAGCPAGPRGEVLRRHGDRFVRLPGGFYRAEGRVDDTMNLGGIKVASLELERVLGRHDAVAECAAIGGRPGGEGAERLVVYVVPDGTPAPETLRRELDALLAQELNPLFRVHEVVLTDALPRTASNKLMRRKLQESWERGRR
jgi:acetyl-CoA synthetase